MFIQLSLNINYVTIILFLDSKRKNGVKKEAYGIDSLDREK